MSDVQAPASLDTVLRERAERVAQPEAEAVEAPQAVEAAEAQEEPVEAAVEAPEAEQPADETPQATEEPEAPAVEAPHYWSAEQKARFAELPADVQAIIAEQEKGRDAAVSKAQQQAAEARKAAEAEAAKLGQIAGQAEQAVGQAEAFHARVVPELGMKWADVDWATWFATDRETAATFRAQYDAEREELQRLQTSRQEAAQASLAEFRKAENAKIAELIPDWTDPKEGPRRAESTLAHLVERGLPQGMIQRLSAFELSVAYDAYRWREAQAKAQALKSAPKQPAPAAKPPVKPAAAQALPSAQRTVIDLEAKAARTGDLDDVLAARAARRRLQGQG
jgi:hypothetical protein